MRRLATIRWLSTVSAGIGVWLILSPFWLIYGSPQAIWNQGVAGALVLMLAIWRLFDLGARWLSMVIAGLGFWLLISLLFLPYTSELAYWNQLLSAFALTAVASVNAGLHAYYV